MLTGVVRRRDGLECHWGKRTWGGNQERFHVLQFLLSWLELARFRVIEVEIFVLEDVFLVVTEGDRVLE
jgi:hypothetical protein